jgi:hypothetical protein
VFVAINVINPLAMGAKVLLGLNLATTYGFGLIIFALLLALFYNRLCATKERALQAHDDPQKER